MIVSFVVSLVLMVIIMAIGNKISLRSAQDLIAIQSTHLRPTSRLGGVAILTGIVIGLFLGNFQLGAVLIVISCAPIFLIGLLEDLTGKISAKKRMLGAVFSALLASLLNEAYIYSIDIWFFDIFLVFIPFAVAFTVLSSCGAVNSFNLIDGVNGFSGGMSMCIAVVLGLICETYDEVMLSHLCFLIAVSIIPFLLFNFPFGLVFLGDAGAYVLGHLLCWIAIVLLYENPEISAWALLLMFFWPITETLLSVVRRLKLKVPSGAPDNLHYHQLLMQALQINNKEKEFFNKWSNPITTLVLLPISTVPIFLSILFIENNLASLALYLFFATLFVISYLVLSKKIKKLAVQKR